MAIDDYYGILGVTRLASGEEIKESFRRLALRYHPDRNKSGLAPKKFKEISEAYAFLSDDEKRRQYDSSLDADEDGADISEGTGSVFQTGASDFGFAAEDLFDSVQGDEEASTPSMGREDTTYHIHLNLEDIASDSTREIEVLRREVCHECGGSAADQRGLTCGACTGSGELTEFIGMKGFGRLSAVAVCEACGGLGYLPASSCKHCGGEGVVERKRRIRVVVPRGVGDGETLRLRGAGGIGESDIYVVINVRPHRLFRREGSELHITRRITNLQAKRGAILRVPTLDGKAELRVPPGSATGTVLRLRGKGLPKRGPDDRGDQFVHLAVASRGRRRRA